MLTFHQLTQKEREVFDPTGKMAKKLTCTKKVHHSAGLGSIIKLGDIKCGALRDKTRVVPLYESAVLASVKVKYRKYKLITND